MGLLQGNLHPDKRREGKESLSYLKGFLQGSDARSHVEATILVCLFCASAVEGLEERRCINE